MLLALPPCFLLVAAPARYAFGIYGPIRIVRHRDIVYRRRCNVCYVRAYWLKGIVLRSDLYFPLDPLVRDSLKFFGRENVGARVVV